MKATFPINLVQPYYSCKLDELDNVITALGISTGNASIMTQILMFSVTLLTGIYLRNKINYSTGFADADEAERLAKGRKIARRHGESTYEFWSRFIHNITVSNKNDIVPPPDVVSKDFEETYLEDEEHKEFNDLTNPDDVKVLKETIYELKTAIWEQVRENKRLRSKIDTIEHRLGKVYSKGAEDITHIQKQKMIEYLKQVELKQEREQEDVMRDNPLPRSTSQQQQQQQQQQGETNYLSWFGYG